METGVAVPNTGGPDVFTTVNLGNVALTQGNHTLRIVFETAGVSLDWFMLAKDTDTTSVVKPSDITMVRPSTSVPLIAPIVAYDEYTGTNSSFAADDPAALLNYIPTSDANGNPYTSAQMVAWYRVPMYEDFDRRTDRFWDTLVDELLASRAQVVLMHCRGTLDFTHDLQDRGYIVGAGDLEGRWLQKFTAAVQRSPQAASALQIGMFFEDSGLADAYQTQYGYFPTGWGDPTLAAYAFQYWLQPWFNQAPASLLYQPTPLSPIINIYTGHPSGLPQDGKMGTFMTSISQQMQAQYGLTPTFLVSPDADASAQALAWGVAPWYIWGKSLYNTDNFNGLSWGFSSAGGRMPLEDVWLNDWDPATNTGTPCTLNVGGCGSPGVDDYQSPLNANGTSVLSTDYSQATAAGLKLIVEEGFNDIPEGSGIFRSYAPGWNFPNEHLAAMREYADPTTNTEIFEAEAADEYYKVNVHTNLGGTYRNQWYSNSGLDVYEPLHNMNPWGIQSNGPGNLVSLSAGFFDVWALDSNGQIWDHGIADGTFNSTWTSVAMNGVPKFTQLAVGKHDVWALNGTSVYTAKIPYQWESYLHTNWTLESGAMVQISVDEANVWGVDANGLIYNRRVNELENPGGVWTEVTGPGAPVNSVYVGNNSKLVWVLSGNNIYYSTQANISWTQVSNPYNLTSLSVGSQEVWGINAAGSIYRRSISGVGSWEPVDGTSTTIAVGENYAWSLNGHAPSSRRLTGFLGAPVAQIPNAPTGLTVAAGSSNGQAVLTWTAVLGAAGYNVKRATVNGGPYTTITMPTTNTVTDTGLQSGITYYYLVTAFNGVGESASSQLVSYTPQAFSMTPAVTSFGQTSVVVSGAILSDSLSLVSTAPFAGAVSLSCAISNPVPANSAAGTCSVTPSVVLSSGGAAGATVTIDTTAGTSGDLNVTITGTNGTNVVSVVIPVTLTASSFTVTANAPATITAAGGATVNNTATITVTSVNGFAGTVTFSCTATNAGGGGGGNAQATCTASPVTLSAGTTQISTVSLASSPGTTGVLNLTLTGTGSTAGSSLATSATCGSSTSSCITATLPIPLTMNMGAIPTISSGATTGNTGIVTMTSQAGFSGSVSLTCSLVPSSGSAPVYPATCSVSPNDVNLTAGGLTTATATISSHTQVAQNGTSTMPLYKSRWTGFAALGGLLGLSIRRRRRFQKLALLICLVAGIGVLAGCGSKTVPTTSSNSSAGSYVLTVTGNVGTLTTTASTSVTIQ